MTITKCIALCLLAALAITAGCSTRRPGPGEVVDLVDLNRYMGRWYEIASFPNSFQKGCRCSTADYSVTIP